MCGATHPKSTRTACSTEAYLPSPFRKGLVIVVVIDHRSALDWHRARIAV